MENISIGIDMCTLVYRYAEDHTLNGWNEAIGVRVRLSLMNNDENEEQWWCWLTFELYSRFINGWVVFVQIYVNLFITGGNFWFIKEVFG